MSPQFRQDSLKSFVCQRNWFVRTSAAIGLAACVPALAEATPPQVAIHGDGAFYTQSDFSIPFQVKPGGRCPQQLDLLVSRDGGRSWHVHQSAAPAEGRFRFAQVEEGEYWLKVQVRDAAGSSLSHSTMHLFVDRSQPTASMQCDWQGDSTLMLTSTVEDAHLDPQSLSLMLRTDVDSKPTPVAFKTTTSTAAGLQCSAVIEMPQCKSFELRLVARDRAGNRLVANERYFHPVLASESDALLPATEEDEVDTPVAAEPELEIAKKEWTTIELGSPKPLTKLPTQLVSADASQNVVRKSTQRPALQPEELIPPERATELAIEPPQLVAPSRVVPNVLSSARKFKINYNLAESVPSDQLQVELWVTTDCGKSWEFWGIDRDAQSPAWIEVDRDGEFGFCVVCIHAESDLKFRPKAGDAPDLSVTVKEPPATRRLQPASRD